MTPKHPVPPPLPTEAPRAGYEPPAVAWEEDFEPAGQSTGCLTGEDTCTNGPSEE